jgi:DNA polymerase-1
VRTAAGREIRRAFVPGEAGWVLLAADYSQIELRILAHLSQDPELIAALKAGRDIHRAVAARIHGVKEEDVDDAMRTAIKAISFGIIYGKGAYSISQELGLPVRQAQEFIDSYFSVYARVRAYLEEIVEAARRTGRVTTLLGRFRLLSEINSRDVPARKRAEREAVNAVIQGSAADLMKQAMVNVYRRVLHPAGAAAAAPAKPACRLLLQIHDELVFELPEAEVQSVAPRIVAEMEQALPLAVPVVVAWGVGRNWLEAK